MKCLGAHVPGHFYSCLRLDIISRSIEDVNKTIHIMLIYYHPMFCTMKQGDSMISERIRALREKANISQSELAKRLSVTRASVSAWESGLSAPTAFYVVEMAKLFHVSSDYLLEIDSSEHISLAGLSKEEVRILYDLLAYFDKRKAEEMPE